MNERHEKPEGSTDELINSLTGAKVLAPDKTCSSLSCPFTVVVLSTRFSKYSYHMAHIYQNKCFILL